MRKKHVICPLFVLLIVLFLVVWLVVQSWRIGVDMKKNYI